MTKQTRGLFSDELMDQIKDHYRTRRNIRTIQKCYRVDEDIVEYLDESPKHQKGKTWQDAVRNSLGFKRWFSKKQKYGKLKAVRK